MIQTKVKIGSVAGILIFCSVIACKRSSTCPPVDSSILADIAHWRYSGSAEYNATTSTLEITTLKPNQAGSAFQTSSTTPANDINIAFEFLMGGGNGTGSGGGSSGADGFALVALDSTQPGTFVGAPGCGLGFGASSKCQTGDTKPLIGWAVELDTWYNSEVDQTAKPHIGFAVNGDIEHEPFWAEVPLINDNQWHQMSVTLSGKHLEVEIDGLAYLKGNLTTEPDFPAWVGFTGSTGLIWDNHFIRGLTVTTAKCAF